MNDYFDRGEAPVCFFDSGIGGLTVLSRCITLMPNRKFVYFADNYNVPYGSFSSAKLLQMVDEKFAEIREYSPSAAVIACNTATAQCASYLRAKYSFNIIGIQPAVKPAAVDAKKCVVLATPATASSSGIKELVERFGNGVTEILACPELAVYIENNIFDLDKDAITGLLPDIEADSIVLGCTHYIFIGDWVKARYKCRIFDGIDGTARHLANVLGCVQEGKQSASPQALIDNVLFVGGDERKNRKVLEKLMNERGGGCGNFSH